ncbi:MAG: hypothetical protein H0U59_00855 [Gemmatimonadaceae bacterium]|nr:hypothetical protein [Gemmatimonadaceae bacterium]
MAHILTRVPRREAGHIFITEADGSTSEADTLQCAHCGMHWMVDPGSGKERGWCGRCSAALCGKKRCFARCIPMEMELEMLESRLSLAAAIHRIKGL